MGEVKFFLKIDVKYENGIYSICQQNYIKKLLSKFGMENSKISKIPIDSGYEKEQNEDKDFLTSNEEYLKLIGSLLYVALNTRPDIAASVCILSQKITYPTTYDWNQLKTILRYLKGTINNRLYLATKNQTDFIGYADANWGENRIDSKSNSGFIFKLNGGTISWCCRKQECVSLSSTEAELIALTEAVKEALWIKDLLEEIDQEIKLPITIYEDNESCRKMIYNENSSSRTKHIRVRYHFIKDYVKKNIFKIKYCPTEEMIADILTKPLKRIKIETMRDLLGIHD